MNQPDLDFGFYRIMHAKAEQVTRFLEDDLLAIVADAFGLVDEGRKARFEAEYKKELKTAIEYGAIDPESVPVVREARARYETAQDTASAEGEIYDHLYRFFERYYDDGDFVSRRYYTRETPGKAAPFAVPYNGEEVKLHWANADQYYIKTAEHFRNFTVDLRQAKEVQEHFKANKLGLEVGDEAPRLVHFRIVDAAEGEHGNIKASESAKRYFVIHKDEPAVFTGEGELAIQFEYRPDPEKSGQEKTWRAKRNAQAVEIVLAALDDLAEGNEYKLLLTTPAPTEKEKERPLLAKYINQYTARNTMDYFIHKDLGAFLRRELDFYIKNEVMRLDDISTAEAPAVETYLSKLKVLRIIAHKLIDFLAQLEDFQKRLWLKKKFVVETNYCITLDRISEEFYPEIAANDAQREEWVRLFAIDEIGGNLTTPAYSEVLKKDFLKANPTLVLDTQNFDGAFMERLLEKLDDLDKECDGILFHGDNFQSLNLMQPRYQDSIKCVYIDPPYNTEQDRATGKFIYKDDYERSSWMTFLDSRLSQIRKMISSDGVLFVSIDEHEVHRLMELSMKIFCDRIGLFTWIKKKKGSHLSRTVRDMTEYVISVSPNKSKVELYGEPAYSDKPQPIAKRTNKHKELYFPPNTIKTTLTDNEYLPGKYGDGTSALEFIQPIKVVDGIVTNRIHVKGPFVWQQSKLDEELASGSQVQLSKKFGFNVLRSGQDKRIKRPSTLLDKTSNIGTNEDASKELIDFFGVEGMASYPKPVSLVEYLVRACFKADNAIVLDCFAGSGTTGCAVIRLNRRDAHQRKFILAEMGDYFDTVLLPRIKKITFAPEWENGKPKRFATLKEVDRSPRIVKILRLESYEDTLNNLVLSKKKALDKTRAGELEKNAPLREDYMLHYMLDVETRGSQSLLNIDAFADPTAYTLRVKKSGSDQYVTQNVDLVETFNYLIGLRVMHIAAPQTFNATFKRETDPDLPEDTQTRLVLDGRLAQDENGPWWFRKVEGWVPADPNNPNNGERQKVLIVWRKLTGQIEEDNLMLNEWFQQNRSNTRDFEFDMIYVNGSNNLPILKQKGDDWKVRLIEEDFMRLMWDVEDV